ncbi:hypothetical protein [Corynebacterium lubricantis]|uniref:hypothetical protein n=1 Tax=Corynebacterium lubricantis TaxID=541095 RepID=UPI0003788355|nr:hypothetical protein [Corynebacterium lubricantis]
MVQPKHERFSPEKVLLDGLRAACPGEVIELGRDASYDGSPVTVVQVPPASAVGGGWNRWLFNVTVVLSTSAPTEDEAFLVHEQVADALLSLTNVDDIAVSSVKCDSEPARVSPHNPSGAELVTSTYNLFLRRVNNG